MGVVVLLLLLMSGDIETNPGPVGECIFMYFIVIYMPTSCAQCYCFFIFLTRRTLEQKQESRLELCELSALREVH